MNRVRKIAILCEDESDYQSIKTLVRRLIAIENMPVDGHYLGGSANLKRKARAYAESLSKKSCDMLILVHDRDKREVESLKSELDVISCGDYFPHYLICIPIEEIEAWFLSDPEALKKVFGFKKHPKLPASPENIASPKEYLENLVYKNSNKERRYTNTKDNQKIALRLSLSSAERKCSSFKELVQFLKEKKYK